MISVLYYGDVLMQLKNNIEPYEDHKGDAENGRKMDWTSFQTTDKGRRFIQISVWK